MKATTKATKWEVVEYENCDPVNDGNPIISDRWKCDSESDAIIELQVRKVEHEIMTQGFSILRNGKLYTPYEAAEDKHVVERLLEMGYSKEEIALEMNIEDLVDKD